MEVRVILSILLAASPAFAGRAFPVDSENFAVALFKTVNPRIEWDPDNYLVDLSGRYALCKHLGINGPVDVTDEDQINYRLTIGGITASYIGGKSDADSVKIYIKQSMPLWLENSEFLPQIQEAQKFGCSIQPNCGGNYVITCLFAPGYKGQPPPEEIKEEPVGPNAQAFTPEQYDVAEAIVGRRWDRSHLLENLSGTETDCAMLINENWSFPKARGVARIRGFNVEPVYGFSENLGRTEPALKEVVQRFRPTFDKFASGKIGCSLIANCRYDARMYVVVSCLISY